MALPYFYEPEIIPGSVTFTLSEETSKHCVKVLRMEKGEQVNLTDGKGNLFTATIMIADKKETEVKIDSATTGLVNPRNVTIGISLLKNSSRFEWFLEKATEIGVSEIIPLLCERTEREHFRYERMNNVLVAAMLQSMQTNLPELHEPRPYDEVLVSPHQKFIAHCMDTEKKELKNFRLDENILILIGPEGDFTAEEIAAAQRNNFQPISLGDTRLRTETAGMVAATLLMNL